MKTPRSRCFVTAAAFWLTLLGCVSAARGQVDLEAVHASLRTAANGGDQVAAPAPGQHVYFHVDYQVSGSGPSFVARVSARIDGEDWCPGDLPFDPETGGVLYCLDEWVATEGTHTLRWELDANDTVAETDESNNAVEIVFTTGRDLEAGRASLRTAPEGRGDEVAAPALGQLVYFHVDFGVAGTGAEFDAEIRALIDGEEQCAGPIPFVPGESDAIWCPDAWMATAGTHTLRWELDYTGAVAETNEENNHAVRTFTTSGVSVCTGDCNDDRRVGIDELIRGVNIALNTQLLDQCRVFDNNGDGKVAINELVAAVNNALIGCA